MQRRIGNGDVVGPSPTFESYLTEWLEAKVTVRKPATMAQYRDLANRFLIPHLGRVKVSDLRAQHVEAMLSAMERGIVTERRTTGRGLVTRRRTVAVLSSALNSAVKRRLVTSNVCQQVELPPERPERRPVWDAAQVSRFLAHVETDRLAALWRLYVLIGLRRGEALALKWDALDLDAGTLTVRETLSEVDGHLVWGAPKTLNGTRTLAIALDTVNALRSHRGRQAAERLALGAAYKDRGLVFCRQDGDPIWPNTVDSRFRALRGEAGMPHIRLHDLRHSAASLSFAAGNDLKTVSSNLGHAGIAITADLYSHVVPAVARAAAERVAALVGENTL